MERLKINNMETFLKNLDKNIAWSRRHQPKWKLQYRESKNILKYGKKDAGQSHVWQYLQLGR